MNATTLGLLSPSFIDEAFKKEKAYWVQQLAGDVQVAQIPLDFRRPEIFVDDRKGVDLTIDQALSKRLLKLCNHTNELVFTLLVASLKILLYKYTNIEDIIIGTAIHKRYSEVASINKILLLRDRISPDLTLRQVLASVRKTLSEAYAHQKYPFDRIIDLLEIDYPHDREPLFSVTMVFDAINDMEQIRHLRNDLSFEYTIAGDQLGGRIVYRPALFKPATIEVLAEQYVQILRSIVDAPDRQVAQVDLLSPARKQALLCDFNRTRQDYPHGTTIHQLIEAQVGQTPDHIAVTHGTCGLTYRDLDCQANRLARYLQGLGIGPGGLVGLYLEHSPETIIGILGILKAGAAYVPLDPDHPPARLAFTLEDARVPVVLTQERLRDRLADYPVQVFCLDSEWQIVARESAEPVDSGAGAADGAYVIYTSGSTGVPKGVLIPHGALINYIWWAQSVYVKGECLAFPLYSSLAFDLTVTSIYTPLITGNRIVVYAQPDLPLLHVLEDNQVDVLKLTPSHLALLKDRDNRASRVKRLIVGGEALDAGLARQIRASFGGCVEIINEYGPTEATVGCMIHVFDPARDDRAFVPIGRPAANTQIYVLDAALRPVAENLAGELYIGGAGLARGYLNRPELTA